MLLSFNALNYALYHNKNRLVKPELFIKMRDSNQNPNSIPNSNPDSNPSSNVIFVNAVILLIIELVFLFYAIQMVLLSYTNTKELVLHLFLAIFFTIPYVLLNAVLSTDMYKKVISV